MTEKRVLEDYVMSGITQARHLHGYPAAFRMAAGVFHAFNALAYGIGGATLILTKDAVISAAQQNGAGIQASSSLGQSVLLLGGIAVGIALLNAWAALSLLTARQQAYGYLVLINVLSFVWMAFLTVPSSPLQWAQLALSGLIAFLLIFDPRVKAFYNKGSFAKAWWDEERRRTGQARG